MQGSGCPHFDTEPERQQFYRKAVDTDIVQPGYALYDDTGAYFVNGELQAAVKTKTGKKVKFIEKNDERTIETVLL